MNHRKRNRLQHKVELSTLLKIVLAKKKKRYAVQPENDAPNLVTLLATEAMEAAKKCDTSYTKSTAKKKTIAAGWTEVL